MPGTFTINGILYIADYAGFLIFTANGWERINQLGAGVPLSLAMAAKAADV
jgi:hypothetical protein